MIRHYIASTLSRLARTPFITLANVLTLALGLACFIAAWGIVTYWRSADGYHHAGQRTVVVGQTNTPAGQEPVAMQSMSSWLLARYLKEDFPELEHVARAFATADVPVAAGASKALLNQAVVDPDFLAVFDFNFLAGNPESALSAPNSVVLTQEAATRLFGDRPALGQSLIVNGKSEATVTGVIAPVRQPSFMGAGADAVLRFDMMHDWASDPDGAQLDTLQSSWMGIRPITFAVLPPGLSRDAFNQRLADFLNRRLPAADKAAAKTTLNAFSVSDLTTFDLDRTLFASSGIGISTIAALLALGGLTLVIACVNYANLATAQAELRAKEIGMRRVLGASALRVMGHAWMEAMLLTAIAALVAIVVLALAAPVFRASTSIDLLYFLSGGAEGLGIVAALVALVAFFSGAYPALILSRVRPAVAVQSGRSRSGSRRIASVLVAIQFASAGFLLILLAVTQLQRSHLERVALAPLRDPVIVLNDLRPVGVDYDTLATRLEAVPGVEAVSVVDMQPWGDSFNGMMFSRTQDAASVAPTAMMRSVGPGYFDVLNLDVLAGRVFDRTRDAPSSLFALRQTQTPSVVIDSRYAEALGFATPEAAIGQIVYIPQALTRRAAQPVEIIGVTAPEASRLEDTGGGGIYSFATKALWGQQRPVVRIGRDQIPAAVAGIKRIWDELAPNAPADVRFFNQLFEQTYRQYARIGQLFILLASAAFFIASIGLVGIAVHVAARRRHEIAVRKTLGSSASRVVRLLLTDFSQPVLIGNLIAWPLAWVAAETYLNAFANRIELSPLPFLFSMGVTLLISWTAVIGVVLRAANLRPAEVLRRT